MKLCILLCVGVLLCGCHTNSKSDDPAATESASSKADSTDLPPAVRDAFARSYPDAKITGVQRREPIGDPPYYQIQFKQNGMQGTVRYFENGRARPF